MTLRDVVWESMDFRWSMFNEVSEKGDRIVRRQCEGGGRMVCVLEKSDRCGGGEYNRKNYSKKVQFRQTSRTTDQSDNRIDTECIRFNTERSRGIQENMREK